MRRDPDQPTWAEWRAECRGSVEPDKEPLEIPDDAPERRPLTPEEVKRIREHLASRPGGRRVCV
jgi:hypothetical protein